MLENQNKALIEELKSLKELYTGNPSVSVPCLTDSKMQYKSSPKANLLKQNIEYLFNFQAERWCEQNQNIFLQTLVKKNRSTLTETKPVKKDRVNETDSASRTYLRKQTAKWSIVRFVLKVISMIICL